MVDNLDDLRNKIVNLQRNQENCVSTYQNRIESSKFNNYELSSS